MRRFILFIAALPVTLSLPAQSGDRNYIKVTTATSLSGDSRDMVIYFDGLGREEQTVMVGGSPAGGSIVSAKEYDEYGREARSWLHGAVSGNTTGSYVGLETLASSVSAGNDNDAMPYSLTLYEASPLSRPVTQYGPGAAWHAGSAHSVRTEYLLNISGDAALNCKRYTASIEASTGGISCSVTNGGDWESGALTVIKVTDEEGLPTYSFYDRNGEVVLSRQVATAGNSSVSYDTYYICDEWGNLQAVLPPMASDQLQGAGTYAGTHAAIANYAYLYCYDNRYRQVGKKLPGCAWVYTIYDRSDAPILTQDGNQRASHEWSAVVPDAWGRPCVSGTVVSTAFYPSGNIGTCVKASHSGGAVYTFSGMPFTFQKVLTETFYDDYTFIGNTAFPSFLIYSADSEYGVRETARPVGLQTGVKSLLLNDAGTSYIYRATYYDYHKKPVQTRSTNHLGGAETEWVLYDLLGRTTKSRHTHVAPSRAAHTQYEVYTYDAWDRLLTHTHQLDNAAPVTIASCSYDPVGRLSANHRNGAAGLTSSYSYNVRSWLRSIGNAGFSQSLYYNTGRGGSAMPVCWNGNISSMEWSLCGTDCSYDFKYDRLHRLTDARYDDEFGDTDAFMTSYGYDKNGNINGIMRQAFTMGHETASLDEMTLYYTGNQLQGIASFADPDDFEDYTPYPVSDSNNAYSYDQNGNTTKDLDRNILSIQYNLLNLPHRITYTDGSMATYTYNSLGEKLSVTYATSSLTASLPAAHVAESEALGSSETRSPRSGMSDTTVDYCGNLVYNGTSLSRILLGGDGYCQLANGSPLYYFFIKDHLGSTRAVVRQDGNVRQACQYYPYGKIWEGGYSQPYLYNGKEIDMMHGLEWYDYGARMYEPGICRFMTMDPFCEKYYSISPYAYCHNNPVMFVDPTGMYPVVHITNQKTGFYAAQRVLGYEYSDNTQYTLVPLYRVIVTDTEQDDFKMEFSVTRDAFATKGIDNDGNLVMENLAFEPQDDNNLYQAKTLFYPHGEDDVALKLYEKGSQSLHAERNMTSYKMGYRENPSVANGIMLHVGGIYKHNDGSISCAASLGCFGVTDGNFSSMSLSNDYSNANIMGVINQSQKSSKYRGRIDVHIDKRKRTERTLIKKQKMQ